MLIILGGVGGAVVSWAGNLINNLINHKREIKRLTYLRKLEVCENAMGVIGTMRDKLVPILVLAKQDPTYQTCDEVSQWCADLHKYLNTTMTEIYKLYLYFDLYLILKSDPTTFTGISYSPGPLSFKSIYGLDRKAEPYHSCLQFSR